MATIEKIKMPDNNIYDIRDAESQSAITNINNFLNPNSDLGAPSVIEGASGQIIVNNTYTTAQVTMIGGKCEVVDDEIVTHPVDQMVLGNVKLNVPKSIQELYGYGWSAGSQFNTVALTAEGKWKYTQNVEKYVIKGEDISDYKTDTSTGIKYISTKNASSVGISTNQINMILAGYTPAKTTTYSDMTFRYGSSHFTIYNNTFESLESVKAMADENPFVIYATLTTPKTTDVTDLMRSAMAPIVVKEGDEIYTSHEGTACGCPFTINAYANSNISGLNFVTRDEILDTGVHGVINVDNFGADPTGTYDSTSAFEAAMEAGKYITGSGSYKVINLDIHDCIIYANLNVDVEKPITMSGNATYSGHITAINGGTLADNCYCMYVKGANNIITNTIFDSASSLFTGSALIVSALATHTTVVNCEFKPAFKLDINVAGDDTTIEGCYFDEHTDSTIGTLDLYCNAIKVSRYLSDGPDGVESEEPYTNGSHLTINACYIYNHGDNAIDCYTGIDGFILSNSFIYSPNCRCIEIKDSSTQTIENLTRNYIIINCVLIGGNGTIYCGRKSADDDTWNIANFEISNTMLYNMGESASVIFYRLNEAHINNCIFEGGITAIRCAETKHCWVEGCDIKDINTTVATPSSQDENYVQNNHLDFTDCKIRCALISGVRGNSVFNFVNCLIERMDTATTYGPFETFSGEVNMVNCTVIGDLYVFGAAEGAVLRLYNTHFTATSTIYKNTSTPEPNVIMIGCTHSGQPSNYGYIPTLDAKLDKPVNAGTEGQVLSLNSEGKTEWIDATGSGEDTKVTQTASTDSGALPLLASVGSTTATTTTVFDADVTLDPGKGELNAVQYTVGGTTSGASTITATKTEAGGWLWS